MISFFWCHEQIIRFIILPWVIEPIQYLNFRPGIECPNLGRTQKAWSESIYHMYNYSSLCDWNQYVAISKFIQWIIFFYHFIFQWCSIRTWVVILLIFGRSSMRTSAECSTETSVPILNVSATFFIQEVIVFVKVCQVKIHICSKRPRVDLNKSKALDRLLGWI